MIPRIPRIGGCAAGIGECRQVAVEIVGLGARPECCLLVVRVVSRRGESRRDVGAGKCATGLDAVAHQIVGIGQGTQRGHVLLVH